MRPVWLCPGASCAGITCASAAGEGGATPNEFLLYWIANPESGAVPCEGGAGIERFRRAGLLMHGEA